MLNGLGKTKVEDFTGDNCTFLLYYYSMTSMVGCFEKHRDLYWKPTYSNCPFYGDWIGSPYDSGGEFKAWILSFWISLEILDSKMSSSILDIRFRFPRNLSNYYSWILLLVSSMWVFEKWSFKWPYVAKLSLQLGCLH